jgi:choline-glycine betaine transporter
MKAKNNIIIYVSLIVASAIFLFIEHLTHIEFMLHVAAIPLEILIAVFIVNMYLENRQKKERRRQLMHIKSCMFRLEMRNLLIADFLALKSPPLTISKIKGATLVSMAELHEYRPGL